MSQPEIVKILGADYPPCAEAECKLLGQDGYCLASCCHGSERAYCHLHSHRPRMLLELVGHDPEQASFTAGEVRAIVMAMWGGAGKVFEAAGYLQMCRDIAEKRLAAQEAAKGSGG